MRDMYFSVIFKKLKTAGNDVLNALKASSRYQTKKQ
jgi:hypothetical protein